MRPTIRRATPMYRSLGAMYDRGDHGWQITVSLWRWDLTWGVDR